MSAALYRRTLTAIAALGLIVGTLLASLSGDVALLGGGAALALDAPASDIDWP